MNGVLSLLCAVSSVLLIVALQLSPQWRRIPATKAMALIFLMLLCDGVAVLFLADRPFWFNVLETASVVASYLAEWCFGLFVVALTDLPSAAKRVVLSFVGVSCLAWIALFIVNCIDPFLYDFGEMRYLSETGAICAQMSGSGSAVFGVFENSRAADAAAVAAKERWEKVFVCTTCDEALQMHG